jgi:hypothetical protein
VTISVAQTVRNTGTTNTSTVSKTVTISSGSCLHVVVGCGSGQTVSGVADGTNTYTSRGSVTHTAYTYKLTQFTAVNVTGGSLTITATISANTTYPWILIQEVTGASAYDARSGAYQGATSSTSTDGITTGTATPSTQPGLVCGLVYGAGSSTPGTGFSIGTFGSDGGLPGTGYSANWATETKRITSTSAVAATWTNGNGADTIASVMAIFDENTTVPSGARYYYGAIK